jgi:hypothetical protein
MLLALGRLIVGALSLLSRGHQAVGVWLIALPDVGLSGVE